MCDGLIANLMFSSKCIVYVWRTSVVARSMAVGVTSILDCSDGQENTVKREHIGFSREIQKMDVKYVSLFIAPFSEHSIPFSYRFPYIPENVQKNPTKWDRNFIDRLHPFSHARESPEMSAMLGFKLPPLPSHAQLLTTWANNCLHLTKNIYCKYRNCSNTRATK